MEPVGPGGSRCD